jgi:chromosome segregation ATPase
MTIGGKPAEDWGEDSAPDNNDVFASADSRHDAWALLDQDYGDEVDKSVEERLPRRSQSGDKIPALLLVIVALAWIGGVSWKIFGSEPGMTAEFITTLNLIALASGPAAVLAIAYLLVGPTSRRETRRYGRTAQAMRTEATRLDEVLAALVERIEANSIAMREQVSLLESKGSETAQQIAEINDSMRENITTLARHSLLLGAAASSAREEMKTLMVDLPDAEQRMNQLTELLRGAGHVVDSQAAGLQSQLVTLTQRARDADETAGIAAERLAGQLERIEGTSRKAAQELRMASEQVEISIDTATDKATRGIEDARRGMDIQSSAMIAMVEQGREALDRTGIEATQRITERMEDIGLQVDSISARLASQEESSTALLNHLQQALKDAEDRFSSLKETATEHTADLAEAIVSLVDHAERVTTTLGGSAENADELLKRAETFRAAIDSCTRDVNSTLPLALAQLEEQLLHSQQALKIALPETERLQEAARSVASSIDEAGEALSRHSSGITSLGDSAGRQLDKTRREAEELGRIIADAEESIAGLNSGASAQLVDALHRVRQAATEATDRARATLGSIIPDAAEALSTASGEAVQRAVSEPVQRQLAELTGVAQQALDAVEAASARLATQMATIEQTSRQIEQKVEEAKTEVERSSQDTLSRRVSLLIESLNSTAIDVTKILSNEVTDSAWAAYLRGDRGVFTRRAVRLLETGEARDIARHYDEEPEFREQVNRYIHDFEAMLRRVLSSRDGNPLGVTLLSSDMGKLYVALAQAIERLRT